LAVIAAYGADSSQLARFDDISYSLGFWTGGTPQSAFDDAAVAGARTAVGMLTAFVEDLDEGQAIETRPASPGGRQVFVVHGRDAALREQVARLLERLDLDPIILQEQTERGRTVIEKFEDHALQVGYAVVLLTPDEFGRGPDDPDWPAAPNRARQNVILELGYFMGALGRARTAAIYAAGTEYRAWRHCCSRAR
jgi:predicted nucleotide-binding protein